MNDVSAQQLLNIDEHLYRTQQEQNSNPQTNERQ